MSHSQKAALRGEPSYVWRDGQDRRLAMIAEWGKLTAQSVALVDGCGNGMYATKIHEAFGARVEAFDIETERVALAVVHSPHAVVAAAEAIPYPSDTFDFILSHEVIEHVQDDRMAVQEMWRVLKVGGRVIMFAPNRWYPFETHGHYWRGHYHFGNTPLINYLPNAFRNQLAPHVRAYTRRGLLALFADLPHQVVHHRRIYGGYDNLINRFGKPAQHLRDGLYHLEGTPLDTVGLSHFLVMEKTSP